MNNKEAIGFMKVLCSNNNALPIVILKTPRVGTEVDNGMGVEFNLKEYTLIYKFEKGSCDGGSLMGSFIDMERRYPDLTVMLMNIDNISSLKDAMEELKEKDDYNVIWKSDDYQEPAKYKSKLYRNGISVNVTLQKEYTLEISYSEIKRYCSNKSNKCISNDDLFFDILRDMTDYEPVISNSTFPRDVAKLGDIFFTEHGIIFMFSCKLLCAMDSQDKNNSKDILEIALKKFESLDDFGNSENFEIVCEEVKKSLNGIVGNEKSKCNTGINIS